MLGNGKLETKEEIRELIEDVFNDTKGTYDKKTKPMSLLARKRMLTKWIKQGEEYYNDVLTAFRRPLRDRYYLGDYITRTVVENAKLDVEVAKEMRKELDEK